MRRKRQESEEVRWKGMCVRIRRRTERKERKERRRKRKVDKQKELRRKRKSAYKHQRICLQYTHTYIKIHKQICPSLSLSCSLSLLPSFALLLLVSSLLCLPSLSIQCSSIHWCTPFSTFIRMSIRMGRRETERKKRREDMQSTTHPFKTIASLSRHTCPLIHHTVIALGAKEKRGPCHS